MPLLCLLRHGIAEDGGADPPLSPGGAAAMREEARGMARLSPPVDRILSSPLRRARETAEIVSVELASRSGGMVVPVETAPELGIGFRPASLPGLFRDRALAGCVLLVGHQPDMGLLAAGLIGSGQPVPFDRGTLCGVEVSGMPQEYRGAIVFLLPPAVLRQLGRGV